MQPGFGIGSQSFTSPFQTNPYALSGYGVGLQGSSPYGVGGQQQSILQWLQAVPQQLHQLQHVAQIQQLQLQQILQVVPQQLQQLQQVIQIVPQQLQQLLQIVAQQQFGGQMNQGQGFGLPFQSLSPFAAYGGTTGQVM